MCGIVHVKRFDKKSANKMVLKRYHKQKSRGSEGFGYVSVKSGKISDYVRVADEKQITKELKENDSSEILFHHRYPTSTPNFAQAAHPIKVSHPYLKYDYYIVHNGVISNDFELKEKHDKLGFVYNTLLTNKWKSNGATVFKQEQWNDSESLAIELALDLDSKQNGIAHVKGSVAFIAYQVEKDSPIIKKMFFGRNYNNPLKIQRTKEFRVIASEGHGEMVEAHQLYQLNAENDFEIVQKTPYQICDYEISDRNYGYGYGNQRSFGFTDRASDMRYDESLIDEIPFDTEIDENEYLLLCAEYEELQKEFSKNKDETKESKMLDRLIELEDMIDGYETVAYGQKVSPRLSDKRN